MAMIKVQDSNGKEFSFDDSKIWDFNGDANNENSSIKDSMRNRVTKVLKTQYINQSGETIDNLQLIKDISSGKTNVVALDVETEATHSGKNHNYVVYYEDSMEKDAESFVNPFKKPMLKNHDDYRGEPIGRISNSWHGPSALTDERSAIHLKVRVTDKDAIPKFLDGRYGTVSIGGSMGTVTCNICGKTILKDGKFSFCGHWKGETYKDQVCYWGAKDIEYHEVSIVNTPADDFAQITKVTVITDEDIKKEENDNKEGVGEMDGQDNKNQTTTTQAKDSNASRDKLLEAIDELLGSASANTSQTQTAQAQEPTTPVATETDSQKEDVKTVEDMQKELDAANQKIADLTEEVATANQKVSDAEKAKEDAIQDCVAMKDQCVQLAIANKTMVADRIIELEKAAGTLEDAKSEERQKELIGQSMKDLNTTLDTLKSNENSTLADAKKRQPTATVKNPTLANAGEQNVTVTDANGDVVNTETKDSKDASVEDSDKETSIEDYTNSFINRLSRR